MAFAAICGVLGTSFWGPYLTSGPTYNRTDPGSAHLEMPNLGSGILRSGILHIPLYYIPRARVVSVLMTHFIVHILDYIWVIIPPPKHMTMVWSCVPPPTTAPPTTNIPKYPNIAKMSVSKVGTLNRVKTRNTRTTRKHNKNKKHKKIR